MSAIVACRGRWPSLFPALGLLAVTLAAVVPLNAALALDLESRSTREPVTVHLDQAQLLKLPERTTTLVIGNPLIADAVVQGTVLVITGKSYGLTNIVALDRGGATLGEFPVQVVGPSENVVVVYRGVERESYSCAINCERRITLGDSQAYFTQALTTFSAYSAQSASGGEKSGEKK
jgi:Flp pilus assembly secretin CpaC